MSAIRRDIFHEHISATKLNDAIGLLVRLGHISVTAEQTPGRPRLMVTRLDANGDPLREQLEKLKKGGPMPDGAFQAFPAFQAGGLLQ